MQGSSEKALANKILINIAHGQPFSDAFLLLPVGNIIYAHRPWTARTVEIEIWTGFLYLSIPSLQVAALRLSHLLFFSLPDEILTGPPHPPPPPIFT